MQDPIHPIMSELNVRSCYLFLFKKKITKAKILVISVNGFCLDLKHFSPMKLLQVVAG
jgi:hypothetical protein